MNSYLPFAMVFVRYALVAGTTYLATNDWLDPTLADAIGRDPEVIQMIATGFAGLITLASYYISESRKALSAKVKGGG